MLSGWLLLIDDKVKLLRLLVALIISSGFLITMLECQPYKRKSDSNVAVAAQMLFVCIFAGGLLVRIIIVLKFPLS